MQIFFNTSFWHTKLCGFWRAAFVFHITRCFLFCWTKLQEINMHSTNPQEIFGFLSQILTWGPNPSCLFLLFYFKPLLFLTVLNWTKDMPQSTFFLLRWQFEVGQTDLREKEGVVKKKEDCNRILAFALYILVFALIISIQILSLFSCLSV